MPNQSFPQKNVNLFECAGWYALTGIIPTGNVIPERLQQQNTYTSFSRPLSIAEDGYTAQFIYEAGGDRVKMHVYRSQLA